MLTAKLYTVPLVNALSSFVLFPHPSVIMQLKRQYKSGKYLGKRCFSVLLHGKPGTGKTEFSKYLARMMKMEVNVVRISDIMDKYVGESEKNIKRTFAESNNRVLVFDEADSMLYSRDNAERSWEISHVNEFLAQMDMFKGILVCTTNLLSSLDVAAIRRFDWKAEFFPLKSDQIYKILCHYFSDVDFSGYIDDFNMFDGISAGDIAVAAGRFLNGKSTADEIITILRNEMKYKPTKQKSLGFSCV
ncbi:MAG: ATP-binding protein [Deferribacteraceae bacterium]|jgi:SpoVK/Ycf46/Vps4 family AAA+-type ATPase|nr:ATP-binding protein [Deferribacteraceae bacterium]